MIGPWHDLAEIKRANRAIGHHWFEPETLRFFASRVSDPVLYGRYFVSSEAQPRMDGTRATRYYTIRRADDRGEITTVGDFQGYGSKRAALLDAEKYFRAEGHPYDAHWREPVCAICGTGPGFHEPAF